MANLEFMNQEKLEEILVNLFKEEAGEDAEKYEEHIEMLAYNFAEESCESMEKYILSGNHRMSGNFANISEDWDYTPTFVKSEVKPWGKFSDIVKGFKEKTISDTDKEKFQTWCLDWFFTAFGTRNLCYNFNNYIADLEDEDED